MTDWEKRCDAVLSALWLAKEPKTQEELEQITGIDRRTIRYAIGDLRDQGHKICSGNQGYWLWDGQDSSWRKTQLTIWRKALNTLARARRMGQLPINGQMTIDDLLDIIDGEVSA